MFFFFWKYISNSKRIFKKKNLKELSETREIYNDLIKFHDLSIT